jgi:hypothetical protein
MWTSERPFFCLYRTYTPLLSLIDLLPFQFQCSDQVPFPSDLSIPLRPFRFSVDRHATQVDRLIDTKSYFPASHSVFLSFPLLLSLSETQKQFIIVLVATRTGSDTVYLP